MYLYMSEFIYGCLYVCMYVYITCLSASWKNFFAFITLRVAHRNKQCDRISDFLSSSILQLSAFLCSEKKQRKDDEK